MLEKILKLKKNILILKLISYSTFYLKKLSVNPALLTVSVYRSPKIFSGPFWSIC